MESTEKKLKEKVVRAFNEYKDYVELTNQENKKKKELLEKVKELYKEDQQDPEIKDFSFEVFVIDGFHKQDIEILGTRFVHYMRLFKEIPDAEEFDEEIETSYNYLKDRALKEQAFLVDKGKFKEVTKGFIEEKRKFFDEKDMYAKVQGELEKYL